MMLAVRLCVVFGYFLAANGNVIRDSELFKLDIVHYNDFHARFEETSVPYAICNTNDNSCLGGFPRLYHEVYALLHDKPDALVLNAGDTYQGTYWYTLLKWNVTQEFINMLHTDVHALGNHEFDDGIPGLVPYIKALKAPVVAANLDSGNTELKGLYQRHVVLEKKGKKIGVIGLITPETQYSSRAQGVTFLDPIKVVQDEAKILTEQGVDIIIVLSHCGIQVDQKIAKEVGKNIDIIVGGHTHSLLWNGEAPSKEVVEGPYPIIVESETKPGHKVLVVTASAYSKYLGNLTAYFDRRGELQSFDGSPVFLNRSIPEDPQIMALLRPYKEKLHRHIEEVVGYTNDVLEMDSCGGHECPLGDMVTDAILNATKEEVNSDVPFIAYMQRSMFRSAISKGEITRGDVINMSPFTNKVVTFRMKGKHLLEQLSMSVNNPWSRDPYSGPNTPQVSGLRVKINTTSAEVLEAAVKVGDEYAQIREDEEYQIVTTDFLIVSTTTVFHKYHGDLTYLATDSDVIEQYIKKISPITPQLDNRLELVS